MVCNKSFCSGTKNSGQRCHSGRRPGIHGPFRYPGFPLPAFAALSFRAKTRNPGSVSIAWIPAPRFRSVVIPGEDPESILPAIRSVVIPGEDPESMVRFDTLDSRSPLSQRCHSGRRPGIHGPFRYPGFPLPAFAALSFRAKTRNPGYVRTFAAVY